MATNTAASFTNHTGNGTAGPFSISFSYLAESEVDVTVGGVLKTLTTHYTFTSATQITFTSGNEPGNGVAINIQRDTNITAKKVDFNDGSVLTESDLDTQNDQILFAVQENLRKLDTIEESATGDQTAAEIRTLVESATDSNVFTDADHTKLNNIEASATADQTASEIRTLVESASDSNVFTDADHTKLNAIEDNATADQTNAEIRAAVEAATDSNVFTDADHTKLNGIETSATADQTGAEIKSLYEGESDTNAFTDAEKTKLSGIETSADVTDATNVDAAGAVMNSDLDGKGELLVGDGSGDPTALSVGQNGYILTADSTEATGIKWAANAGGGGGTGISNIVEDTTPQLGGNLDVQTNEITTSTTNGNVKLNPNGTGVVEVKGDGSSADGTIQLNCSQNSHGVKIKSPPHSANASYTLTLPNNDGNSGQFLKTDGSGVLSFDTVTTDLIGDTSPQLGGNLDLNSNDISGTGNISINGNLSGNSLTTNAGNIIINSTAPTVSFVDSDANPDYEIKVNGGEFDIRDSTNNASKFKINTSGEVVSQAKLNCQSGLDTDGDVVFNSDTTNVGITFDASTSNLKLTDSQSLSFGDHSTTGDYQLNYVNGSDFNILGMDGGSGDLVLGTFASGTITKTLASKRSNQAIELYFANSKKLETVTGGVTVTGTLTATAYAGDGSGLTGIASSDKITEGNTEAEVVDTGSDGHFKVTTEGTERLRVTADGQLLVGTTASSAYGNRQMAVGDASGSNAFIEIRTSSTGTGHLLFSQTAAASSGNYQGYVAYNHSSNHMAFHTNGGNERMRISSDGGLFLGVTSAVSSSSGGVCFRNNDSGRKELLMGTTTTSTKALIEFINGNGGVGSISVSGSNTSYNTSSDYRLKENVVAISDGITRLKTLKPSRFNFIADAETIVDGFLAHEVTAVPEAVTGTKDEVATEDSVSHKKGDPIYQAIDQSKLVPLLTAALQEAIAKIETLETKVAALEAG